MSSVSPREILLRYLLVRRNRLRFCVLHLGGYDSFTRVPSYCVVEKVEHPLRGFWQRFDQLATLHNFQQFRWRCADRE